MKFFSRTVFIITPLFLVPLFSGCGMTSPMLDATGIRSDESAGKTAANPAVEEALAPPDCITVTDLIQSAKSFAEEGDYVLAHKLLKEAYAYMTPDTVNGEPGWLQEKYFGEIVGIYGEMMPLEYADSTPEEISMLVFQQKVEQSWDSVTAAASDSILTAALACQKGTGYGVAVPVNDRVVKSLYFLSRRRKGPIDKWLSRAAFYLPVMKRMLVDSGLPADLAYLPLIESGFNPKAYSYAHASGIWQFIAPTGSRYGLRQSFWLDERRDPLKSTWAAAAYLKKLYGDFNDWHLALAAYNCGENGVQRAIDNQGVRTFWELRLPKQTMNYVPEFIAALMIAKNPSCFGYQADTSVTFDYDTVYVSDCLDMGRLAAGMGTDEQTLRAINPHIMQWCTPPDMADVLLYLPAGSKERFTAWVSTLTEKDKVKWARYRIRPGDNLGAIARRFGLSVDALRSVNRLRSNRIVAGKYLFIPTHGGLSIADAVPDGPVPENKTAHPGSRPDGRIRYKIKKGETLSGIAETFDVKVSDLCTWNDITPGSLLAAGAILIIHPKHTARAGAPRGKGPERRYTVARGDNLYSIARSLGVGMDDLVRWNGKDPDKPLIFPGEIIVYYGGAASPAAQRPSGPDAGRTAIRYKVSPGDNLTRIAGMFSITVDALLKANNLSRGAVIKAGDILIIRQAPPRDPARRRDGTRDRMTAYRVKKGDNAWTIARAHGVPVSEFCRVNGLTGQSVLTPGDILRIPVTEEL